MNALEGVTPRAAATESGLADGALTQPGMREAAVLFVGPTLTPGDVRRLRACYPAVVLGVCSVESSGRHWPLYARAGADAIWLEGNARHGRGLAAWVQERLALPAPAAALERLRPHLARGLAGHVLGYCLRDATRARRVASVAGEFGCSARTLRRTMRAAELPSVEQLWRLGRLLHVVEISRRDADSIEEAARRAGYADAKAYYAARATLRQVCWAPRASGASAARGRATALRRLVAEVPEVAWALGRDEILD